MADCDAGREMPKYKCYKEVHALKIVAAEVHKDGSATLVPGNEGFAPFKVAAEFVSRVKITEGGYYVVYKDGYKSFSPAEAFESGYTEVVNG